MKKILSFLTVLLLAAVTAIGQSPAPGIFNYQGVARNSVGNVLSNKVISLRLTIHDGAPAGPTVYQESRTVTTNPFGLFNVQVGSPGASSSSGTIAGVNWGVGNKYIQVEIDPNGGSTYINIGTAQIASVPYSLYSSLSNDLVLPFNKTQADAGTLFKITNSGAGAGSVAIEGLTNSPLANVSAVIGTVTTTGPGAFSAGVRGINNGTSGLGIGVWGSQNGGGWGVYGTAPSGIGGNFSSSSGTGAAGSSSSGTGVSGLSTSGSGLSGVSTSGAGVLGNSSTGNSGRFINTNLANTAPTVYVESNATTGTGLRVNHTGSGKVTGVAGWVNTTTGGSTGVNGADFSSVGVSPIENRTYGVLGQTGTTGIAVGAYALNGGTALRGSNPGATGWALQTSGRVQLNGINEAVNRILTTLDGTGNATWQNPAAVGIVTGSGTVNFVPKWTPVGTNLGNSRIFDDGTFVGIGTTTPGAGLVVSGNGIWNSAIGIENTGAGMEWRMNVQGTTYQVTKITGATFTPFQLFSNGQVEFPSTAGSHRLRILDNGNVGIGTTTPVYKQEIFTTGPDDGLRLATNSGNNIRFRMFNTTSPKEYSMLVGGAGSGFGSGNFALTDVTSGDAVRYLVNGTTGNTNIGGGTLNPVGRLHVMSLPASGGPIAIMAESNNTDANAYGMVVRMNAAAVGAQNAAIRGVHNSTGSNGIAVWGQHAGSGWGVNGTSETGIGVLGQAMNGSGGVGYGVWGETFGTGFSGGVFRGLTGNYYGSYNDINNAAGYSAVMGRYTNPAPTNPLATGVWGINDATNDVGYGGQFSHFSGGTGLYATSATGLSGLFRTSSLANTTSSLVGTNPASNIGSWGVLATSVTGTGYPGETNPAALVAQTNNSLGIVSSSFTNYAIRAGSFSSTAIYGEAYPGGAGAGVFGVGIGPNNFGVVGNAAAGTGAGGYFTGGTTALRTLGGVQLTGINEGVNRILATVPGTGQATWEDAATVGIVSGSGTLNFLPKWTPSGTALGNSMFYDDASTANLGGGAGGNRPSSLTLWQTPGTSQASLLFHSPVGELNGIHNENDGKLYFTANTSDPSTADKIMTIDDNNLSVGIGTTTPAAKLNVVQADATSILSEVSYAAPASLFAQRSGNTFNTVNGNYSVSGFSNHSTALMPGWKAGVIGVDSSNTNFASGVGGFYKGNSAGIGVYGTSSQNKDFSGGAITSGLGFVAGAFYGGDAGVHANAGSLTTGTSTNKYGVFADALTGTNNFGVRTNASGGTNAYGIYATASGAANNWAGFFNGRVAITDGTEGNGYVFTSDASGNGSWQGPVSITARTFSSNLTIPHATLTPITQWNTILNEDGGSNYNPATGEYTIPVSGFYQINASVLWDVFPSAASTALRYHVNGNFEYSTWGSGSTSIAASNTLSQGRRFNQGDVIQFLVAQYSGVSQTLTSTYFGQSFSIELIHR
jgi:hypothetical protein